MKFSDIQYILRKAISSPAPPPSPAIKPIALSDLEAQLIAAAVASLHNDIIAASNRAPAFGGPPLASKKLSFEEIFGEDSDEESEDD